MTNGDTSNDCRWKLDNYCLINRVTQKAITHITVAKLAIRHVSVPFCIQVGISTNNSIGKMLPQSNPFLSLLSLSSRREKRKRTGGVSALRSRKSSSSRRRSFHLSNSAPSSLALSLGERFHILNGPKESPVLAPPSKGEGTKWTKQARGGG